MRPMSIAWNRIAAPLALFVFAILLVVVGVNHEPWFDEAQAWLIARDSTPWSLVMKGVRYEGTPALWHGLLWLMQRFGLPYGGLWLVSSTLAFSGAWIVVYKSPFPFWLRIGLIFSYFFAYQYSVVARSYALDLLFLPLLAWLFQGRLTRPLLYMLSLGLLANTNAHSFMLAGVLAMEFAWSARKLVLAADRRIIAAILIFGLFAIAAIFQAWPPKDINFIIPKKGDNPFLNTVVLFTEAFIERGDVWSIARPSLPWRIVGMALTAAVIVPCTLLWLKAGRLPLALCLFSALIAFSVLKYGNLWHAGIIFLTFVFCLWISWAHRAEPPLWSRRWLTAALAGLVAFQVWCAAAAGIRDVSTLYSAAPATAKAVIAIRLQHPETRIGVAGFKGFAILPWLPGNVFANYEAGAAHPSYYLWRRGEAPIPGLNEALWRQTAAAGYDHLLLSTFNVMGFNGPARYILDAWRAGYCPASVFRGAMVWKSYALETDDMVIFDRCPPLPKPRRSNSPSR